MWKLTRLAVLSLASAGCVGTGALPGGTSCPTGQVTLAFDALTVTDTCFAAPGIDPARTANIFSLGATNTVSANGTGTAGIQLVFSAAAGCTFAAGSIVQLSDPCLFVGQTEGDPALPSGLYGYVNTCAFSGVSSSEEEACTSPGVVVDTSPTTGSVTIGAWSAAPGGQVEVTFSSDAALTAISPNAGSLSNFAVPVAGTLSVTVPAT